MKTHIYACYLSGSASPDYIGSHKAEAPAGACSLMWKYANGRYLGQGVWIHKETGAFIGLPKLNTGTPWGSVLCAMSPEERLVIRVDVLAEVEETHRWTVEAMDIRTHKPPFNSMVPMEPEEKRGKRNTYMRGYLKNYLASNPEKLAAKRKMDRERARAKRAANKKANTLA